MEVSSERRLSGGESVESVLFAERAEPVNLQYVADEEFPSDLPNSYDWLLQPASQRASGRKISLIALMVAVLVIAISLCLVYKLPRSLPSMWTSMSSSSH
jgi:hypothetical protein